MLISVHLHFFLTNVVPSGDFSVYVTLMESEKLSLEGTFSKNCHVNVSVLPVGANKCTSSFLSDQCCPKCIISEDFSVYVSQTESEKTVIRGHIFQRLSCE